MIDFTSASERISLLTIKAANKAYTLINVHAPTNHHNKTDPESVDDVWEPLEESTNKIPQHHVDILLGDFNAQLGNDRKFRDITGRTLNISVLTKLGKSLLTFAETSG